MKYKLLIAEGCSAEALAILQKSKLFDIDCRSSLSRDSLLKVIHHFHALSIRTGTQVDRELLERAANLKLIARAGVGLDHIDCSEALKRKISIAHTPSAASSSVADLTILLALSLLRKFTASQNSIRRGQWRNYDAEGHRLDGQVVGIVGLGRIGKLVATRLQSFGCRVISYDPFVSEREMSKLDVKKVSFSQLIRNSFLLSLHAPLTNKTYQLFDWQTLSSCRRGIFIVNTARGALVNEAALLKAIQKGTVLGYASDVLEKEPPSRQHSFLKRDEILITPHIGAQTIEAQREIQTDLANQIVKFFRTGQLRESSDLRWTMDWQKLKD